MKKIVTLICFCLFSFNVFAQEEKTELSKPVSPVISALQTGAALAQYGYENYSPTALVEAARIIGTTQTQAFEFTRTGEVTTAEEVTKDTGVAYDPAKLLADAKKYAGKDKAVLTLIKNTEKEIQSAEGQTRGVVGGSKSMEDIVPAHSTNAYKERFWGGEVAEVVVFGDGDTDLDLYIYDENDNLITSDTDYTDICICRWNPIWTGYFIIKVVNRGSVYNAYVIATN
ncbi:MAG: hypothetical protein IKU36_03140 [Bacteroidales bacterium]|nr:hypothetical protein [Bacteroidales bacterium]